MSTEIQDEKSEGKPQQPEAVPLPRTLKILTTCAVFYGNITFGAAMVAFSPALTDFRKKFDNVGSDEISIVFVITTIFYMVGALLCSFIYNIVNRQLTVVFLFSGIAAVMFLSPHVPTLTLFYCMGGLLGLCMGSYDVAQVVWIMEMWQAQSAPFVQAQHFFWSVGSMISPLIMSPFLTEEEEEDEDSTTTTPASTEDNKRLFIPFTILGCLCALTAVAQLLLFIFMRYRPPPPQVKPEEDNNNKDTAAAASPKELESQAPRRNGISGLIAWTRSQWPGWGIAKLVILSCMFIGFDQGMETSTMNLFPTFGQNIDLHLSESKAADTLSGLTGAFMAARGAAIILVFKIPPHVLVFANLAFVLAGNIILVIWANTSLTMLWTAGVLFGIGYSTLMPSFCAYMERYLEFTNTIGALMIVTGAAVGAVYPAVVGKFIDDYPMVLCYPIFSSVAMCTFASVTAYLITRKTEKRA